MNQSTSSSGSTPPSIADIGPFNMRLTFRPLRCVTGHAIAPGLVGFCWETPLSLEVLRTQAPDLATLVALWPGSLRPIVEAERRTRRDWLVDQG